MPGLKKHPHARHPFNIKESVFVKVHGSLVNKEKHLLKISVKELQNDMILPSSEGGFSGARTVNRNTFIGDMSLRKYITKYIKPMSNINKIICGCKKCISEMLLQSDLNK